MDIKRIGPDHLVVTHDGIAAARPMMWVALACIAAAVVIAFLGGSLASLIVVIVVAGLILSMLWRASARTAAVFDRGLGTLAITHTRGGEIVGEDDVALSDIACVIVEPSAGSGMVSGQNLSLRPAVLADGRIIPLTYRSFESGPRPVEVANALRQFLGLSDGDLIARSVEALARHDPRIQPAVRLARIGLGLDRHEAAAMVAGLRAEARDD